MIYCIAEAGVNHNGSFDVALKLIDAAKSTGADAVKFQMFDYRLLHRPALAQYQLGKEQLRDLRAYAMAMHIDFLCTPFDPIALRWLADLGVKRMKLASGAVFDAALLEVARECNLPLILSTGMATLEEVGEALTILDVNTDVDVTLLHCTSAYPAPLEAVNLRAMLTLQAEYGCPIGYSDHTAEPDVLVAAAALGAEVIEAHITLDRDAAGPDHAASYEPSALGAAIARIRRIEVILGSDEKTTQVCERPAREVWA